MHHVLVGHVRVREDDLVDPVRADKSLELAFGPDGDAVGVQVACERRRIDAAVDVGDLGRGEGDHFVLLAAAVDEVEVVEVAAGRSHDQYPGSGHE